MAVEMIVFLSVIGFVIVQRIVELFVARNNEVWMRSQGAYEVGASHYPFMVAIHVGFFISLIFEFVIFGRSLSANFLLFFVIFLGLQMMRVWVISSLGRFWNTKIIVLPGAHVVNKGPFRLIKHPNYVVVSCEIFIIPLMFGAYFTALVFTLFNLIILSIRIPIEEAALREVTDYKQVF
ncbi:isoprenylcysteine carboxyl methyltransferase family protein [Paenisporosarcina sp. TG-14]|uniref:isoprenylcysteine carboxyl methyltransferase family protein n=1 Tax=Paenisporosarcina sp. TG-14 TaxID=1231057 RepID=UPI00030D36A8|nr:isoprenylcysteine carboxylmethyltransferase family protein [Paenisporosarcina sp. TG-14]